MVLSPHLPFSPSPCLPFFLVGVPCDLDVGAVAFNGNVVEGRGLLDCGSSFAGECEWSVGSADDAWRDHQREFIDQTGVAECSGDRTSTFDQDTLKFPFAKRLKN